MATDKTLTEQQVIRLLKKLERGWPDNLWLWVQSDSDTLSLMKKGPSGKVIATKDGSVSPSGEVVYFNIEADGGYMGNDDGD